mgnify:CR=1 FL=1
MACCLGDKWRRLVRQRTSWLGDGHRRLLLGLNFRCRLHFGRFLLRLRLPGLLGLLRFFWLLLRLLLLRLLLPRLLLLWLLLLRLLLLWLRLRWLLLWLLLRLLPLV